MITRVKNTRVLKSSENTQNTIANPCKPKKTTENNRKQYKTIENHRTLETLENHRKIYNNSKKSENHRKPLKTTENKRKQYRTIENNSKQQKTIDGEEAEGQ